MFSMAKSESTDRKELALVFDDRILSAPLIREPICEGRALISFGSIAVA